MKTTSKLYKIIVLLLLLPMVGCGPSVDTPATEAAAAAAEVSAKATKDAVAAATAEQVLAEAEAHDAQSTADAQATVEAEAQAAATAASIAEATAASQATSTQAAVDRSVTATARAFERATQTAEAIAQATAAAQPMADIVQKLNTDGFIKATAGEYLRLPITFDEAWAQIGWYQWMPTGIDATNFVIRTDASWDSGSDTPNKSGCGFVIRTDQKSNHSMIFLSMTGYSVLGEMKNEYWRNIRESSAPRLTFPKGSAEITLAVEDEWITMLVNGEKVLRDGTLGIRPGELALTIISGTNKGFGTACTMENIDIWILE